MNEKFPILMFFEYDHLPEHLRDISAPFCKLAHEMAERHAATKYPAELAAGLRKLLEAKDCAVRAGL